MADRKHEKRAKDEGSDSAAAKQAAKGYDDATPPTSQADGDPGPEETKAPDTLKGEEEATAQEK